jgi:hypothetical protein
MSNVSKSLDNIFDVPKTVSSDDISFEAPTIVGSPQEVKPIYSKTVYVERSDEVENQEADFKLVRKNMRDIVEKGNEVLNGIVDVARDTDKPSAYEAAGVILKNLMEANEKLLDIHEKHKKFQKKDTENGDTNNNTGVNVENAVFVGTAADFLKQVKKAKENVQD